MTTPDLTQTLRSALDKVLGVTYLTGDERAALEALRDACPEPRWLPTGDGAVVRASEEGTRSIYYVRDGKVGAYLRADGTLRSPLDPADFDGTWEPYVHEVTPEQINAAVTDNPWPTMSVRLAVIRTALPALGCREVTR